MLRLQTAIATVAIVVAVLSAAPAAAQTTTTKPPSITTSTSTSTSTSTTLLPHPFSKGTAACVRKARADRKACRRQKTGHCFPTFQFAYAACFASGAGVKCATKCLTTEATCFGKVPTTKKNCRKSCFKGHKADVAACRLIAGKGDIWAGGDGSCLSTAAANFALCQSVCQDAKIDCRTARRFCIANCKNL